MRCIYYTIFIIEKIYFKKKINYLWLLAANSDIQAGIRDRNVDLVKTFMTTKISLDFLVNMSS